MPTSQPRSGINVYTTTTGTGSLSLTTAVPGYLDLGPSDTGLSRHYGIYQGNTAFEVGIGTYNHAARTFSRDTVLNNVNGTATAYAFGGGLKELSIVQPAERTAMLDVQGRWLEPQYWGGKPQYLDADEDSWHGCESNNVFTRYLGATLVYQQSGGVGQMIFIGTDSGAGEGPERILRRDTASAAANDAGPVDRDQMRDVNGALVTTYKRRSVLLSATAGAHSSSVSYDHTKAGALQPAFTHRPDFISVQTGMNVVTAAKTALSTSQVGAEMRATGEVVAVVDAAVAGYFCRNVSDGDVLSIVRAGTVIGSASTSGATVTWGAFVGGHWSDWAAGEGGVEFEELGTVVSTANGILEDMERLPLVRPAVAGDANVYGIIQGRQLTRYSQDADSPERALLMVHGLGASVIRCGGAVVKGDLLCASATPGVAEVQEDDIVRSTTVAKATQDSADDGEVRLVPCVLMAG